MALDRIITLTPSSSASLAYTTPGSEQASTILARTAARPSPAAHSASRARSATVKSNSLIRTAATIKDTITTYGADLRRDTLAG